MIGAPGSRLRRLWLADRLDWWALKLHRVSSQAISAGDINLAFRAQDIATEARVKMYQLQIELIRERGREFELLPEGE